MATITIKLVYNNIYLYSDYKCLVAKCNVLVTKLAIEKIVY